MLSMCDDLLRFLRDCCCCCQPLRLFRCFIAHPLFARQPLLQRAQDLPACTKVKGYERASKGGGGVREGWGRASARYSLMVLVCWRCVCSAEAEQSRGRFSVLKESAAAILLPHSLRHLSSFLCNSVDNKQSALYLVVREASSFS